MIELEALVQYGLIAFIPVLCGVIIYLNKQNKELQKKYDDLLTQRGDEHKEALLALSGPIERLANISEYAQQEAPRTKKRSR